MPAIGSENQAARGAVRVEGVVSATEAPAGHFGMRGFWALIATQFQGAFNDNLFKFLIIYFLVGLTTRGLSWAERESATGWISGLATMVFALPFIVFPGPFGALSDRYSKRTITIWAKYIEVAVMALGIAGFFLKLPWLLWVMLFCMAAQSAFFSPSKYGILPETLPESRLSWGNGVLAMFTMFAIIAGTGVAGPIYNQLDSRTWYAGVLLTVCSMVGVMCSYGINHPPAADPQRRIPLNPWADMGTYAKLFLSDRWLLMTLIGYTYFWFAGAFLQANIISYGNITLAMTETQVSVTQAALAVGIGVGSLGAGYLSWGKIELGLVPIGLGGVTVLCLLLALPGVGYGASLVLFVLMGISAGLFNVPLAAAIQHRSPAKAKGGVLALVNVMTFFGTFLAGGLVMLLTSKWLAVSPRGLFVVMALLTAGLAIFLMVQLPLFVARLIVWFVFTFLYRVRVRGRENFPMTGGALLVSNHVSYLDPGFVLFSVDRPVRYMMYSGFYKVWWMRQMAKVMNVIPVAATDGRDAILQSLQRAREAVERGEVVCIFPEGGITRSGSLITFQRGCERIMRGLDAPIIPVNIDNMWGSMFSYSGGRFFKKWPRQIFSPVTVTFGKPMPADTPAHKLRQAVQSLQCEALFERRLEKPLLHRWYVKMVRRHPGLLAMADQRSGELSYFKSYVAVLILARKLKKLLDKQPMVGLLVPPSIGGALSNVALQLMGRVAVNLNYTSSDKVLASAARQCEMSHCITAKAFLERVPVTPPAPAIYLEDVMKSVTKADRILALLMALLPLRVVERMMGAPWRRTSDDLATVIFSSGSEGEPKGVLLTHRNVISNITSFAQVIPHQPGEHITAFLPFFHSFGFTGTFWAPLTHGVGCVFHPNPLETKAIGELIRKHKAKFLVGTPTFLQHFIRRCAPEDLQSLTLIFAGAERLTARVREAFKEKFGVEPLEGYGTTECSPVVSAGLPDYRDKLNYQQANKAGTVGRVLPGVDVRLVHPETGELMADGEPGLLQVRGANVMKGYLGLPEKTAQVLSGGWYSTGDIAIIDEQGFITITDRYARFSKIAGEMVSHTNVEETLHRLLDLTELSMAVAGLPDVSRGERLVVLHTLEEEQIQALVQRMENSDLPNLWRPRLGAFHRVDAIPVLGTGKMDLRAVKEMAAKLGAEE